MDATVHCRHSGIPFSSYALGATPPAPGPLHPAPARHAEPRARRKPSPHHQERPP